MRKPGGGAEKEVKTKHKTEGYIGTGQKKKHKIRTRHKWLHVQKNYDRTICTFRV